MIASVYPGPFAPDSPARRLPWVLAIAVLLVLLALLGLGRILHPPVRQPAKLKPLQAQIYELPASHGAAMAKAAPVGRHAAHASVAHSHRQINVAIPQVTSPKAAALASSHHAHQSHYARNPQPLRLNSSAALNWSTLQSQIDSAVRQSDSLSSPPQIHNPHTLVARYYIKSLLLKLQRIGDMNDPTNLTGMPVLGMVIGSHGELQQLKLLHSSGNDKLDHDALQIARESAPFSPFPDNLKRQTQQIKLVCYMQFEGYRRLYTDY